MNFANPQGLFWLWILPVLLVVRIWSQRQRWRAAIRFAQPGMLVRLLPPDSPWRLRLAAGALIIGLGCFILAAAQPQWGEYYTEVTSRGVDVFVLLDVSRSMLAEDVSPNRLERAKSDILDLLPRLGGDRVGLIAFAGSAVVKVPLTHDHAFFRTVLEPLGPADVPRGGTALGDAIRKALAALDRRTDRERVLLLLTDGEDHESFPLQAAQQAAEQDVKIFGVGLGDTKEGRRIPLASEASGPGFLRYQGQEVWSRMDERLLKEVALLTEGAYVPARTQAYDLGQIYRERLGELARGGQQQRRQRRPYERFQVFLATGLFLLLLETWLARYPRGDSSTRAGAAPGGKLH